MCNILKRYSRFFSPVHHSPRVLQYDRLSLNVQYKSGPLITLHIIAELRVIFRQLSLGSCSSPSASWEVDKTFTVPKRAGNFTLSTHADTKIRLVVLLSAGDMTTGLPSYLQLPFGYGQVGSTAENSHAIQQACRKQVDTTGK